MDSRLSESANPRGVMDFLTLPDAVMQKIASYLDWRSLIALHQTDRRLRRVAAITELRLKYESLEVVKRCCRLLGPSMRSLNLSDSLGECWPRHYDNSEERERSFEIQICVFLCPIITELTLLGTRLLTRFVPSILNELPYLEKLSYTAITDGAKFIDYQPKQSLKHLYLEIRPTADSFDFVMNLINVCETIEVVHVILIGRAEHLSYEALRQKMLPMNADRFKTLDLFVCSSNWSSSREGFTFLLESVFFHRPDVNITKWLERGVKCFIYEHEHFNGIAAPDGPKIQDVRLLTDYGFFDLSRDNKMSPWKPLRSLRVEESAVNTSAPLQYLSQSLVELDISACHGRYERHTQIAIMKTLPCLRMLAVPACFYCNQEADIGRTLDRGEMTQLLHESKVRKLFMKGKYHTDCATPHTCSCGQLTRHRCWRCQIALTSENLPNFSAMRHLEEFVVSEVRLEDSAYGSLANPNMRTARLASLEASQFSGLGNFLRHCENLRYFALFGEKLVMTNELMWASLAECRNLKQLCVATSLPTCFATEPILDFLTRLAGTLEILHIHHDGYSDSFMGLVRGKRVIDPILKRESGIRDISFTYDASLTQYYGGIANHTELNSTPGRALCCTESRVGFVELRGWDVG